MKLPTHDYPFDPSYGYSLKRLLAVVAPEAPADFEGFWKARYEKAMTVEPEPVLKPKGRTKQGWRLHELVYRSTGAARIGGWCLTPAAGTVERVIVVLHGYGGREGPDFQWPFENTALLFPCARGIGRSPYPPVSANSLWHVLHDIQDRDRYVHGGCVDDVWLGVGAALRLFPQAVGRVGLIGASFGGGIGTAPCFRKHHC